MQIYPLGLLVILIWIWTVRRDLDRGVQMVAALFPFGMFSIISIGGFSLIADDFIAAVTIGLATVFLLIRPMPTKITLATIPLVLFGAYATFASTVLVRVFAGDAQVFAFNRLYDGERVSVHFSGSKNLLAPSASNISQLAYVLLAVAFFVIASRVGQRRGRDFLLKGLYVGGIVNVVLAVLDLFQLDALLSVIRTADYSLLNELTVAGLPRIIGGFAEASEFGAVALGFGSFLFAYGLLAKHRKYWVVGSANLVFAGLSLSSTAVVGLAIFSASFVLGVLPALVNEAGPKVKLFSQFAAAAVLLVISLLFFQALWTGGSALVDILDRLVFSKKETVSGMERLAMARNGIEVFWVSWGLGAGVGTVLANGYGPALLASVGIPGALLMVWFYWQVFFPSEVTTTREGFARRRAAQVFFIPSLAIAMVSSVSVSPGMMMLYVGAIAVTAASEVSTGWLEYDMRKRRTNRAVS